MLCGSGLPDDDENAIKLTEDALSANRIVWEVSTDDGLHKPPFAYTKRAEQIRMLYDKYPDVKLWGVVYTMNMRQPKIDANEEILKWTADWITEVGDQQIGEP